MPPRLILEWSKIQLQVFQLISQDMSQEYNHFMWYHRQSVVSKGIPSQWVEVNFTVKKT